MAVKIHKTTKMFKFCLFASRIILYTSKVGVLHVILVGVLLFLCSLEHDITPYFLKCQYSVQGDLPMCVCVCVSRCSICCYPL